ncbi:MAG: MarR family winged helix-turn-helix transcriptional regulator [Christensenellales bacterium]|jgi:MarR family transcriptional regulator for hemolysin
MTAMRDIWLRMKAALRLARQSINERLAGLNLTGAEGDILYHLLAAGGGLSQEQLAERLDVGKGAISRTVDSLVAKGFAARARRTDDARAYRVTPTAQGLLHRAAIERAYHAVYEIAKDGISEAELAGLARMLERVAENLDTRENER